jgi:hypothetical protein
MHVAPEISPRRHQDMEFYFFSVSMTQVNPKKILKKVKRTLWLEKNAKRLFYFRKHCLIHFSGSKVYNTSTIPDAKAYKFNQVLDQLLLEFVHTKLDLYKNLTEPKVNEILKRQWFEMLAG